MWLKSIIAFLISLHLLASPPKPTSAPIPAPANLSQNGLSISDIVYADLALQHELDHVSVYYFDDNPKNTVSINPDKSFDPASTVKLYVAMYAFDQVATGNISLDQTVTIEDKNVAPSQSFPNGYSLLNTGDTVSVYELLDRMITQSGNTSYNTLLDLLDRSKITKYVHDLGLVNSNIGSKLNLDTDQEAADSATAGFGPNSTNADDYARAFILINGKRLPGSASLFNMLSREKFSSMLPALLPKDVVVAHKTGELDPYYHDGGIIVGANRKYVLSVFSDMGDPNVVAHISALIYTNNANIVGNNNANVKNVSEVPDAPIDPLVAAGEENTDVLAAKTQDIKMPKFSASDLGIKAQDISGVLNQKQLPTVLIPADSPLHFLLDLGEPFRMAINPVQSMELKLAEANNLIARNKVEEANAILNVVDTNLAEIAKNKNTVENPSLQSSIRQVSETRFAILGAELSNTKDTSQRDQVIKNIADQARSTVQNVKPYIASATVATNLSQNPVVGKVVKATQNSITLQTADGKEVTSHVGNEINSRDVGQENSKLTNATEIPIGSTVAVTPFFILTKISGDTAPVTVLKVNNTTNTLVIASGSGTPVQVDLTSQTVIKGSDTSVSLAELKPGDVVVVHSQPLPAQATPSANLPAEASAKAGPTPISSTIPSNSSSVSNNPSTPIGTSSPLLSPTPLPASNKPVVQSPTPSVIKPTSALVKPVTTSPQPPTVVKGNVIQIVQTPPKTVPSQPKVSATPAPASPPPSTPPPGTKH